MSIPGALHNWEADAAAQGARFARGGAVFGTLVRARARMLWNGARGSTGRQRLLVGILSALGLLFAGMVAAIAASLVLLAQGGVPPTDGLTPAAASLVARAYEYLFFFLLAGAVPFVAATLFQGDDMPLLLTAPVPVRAIVGAKLVDAAAVNAVQSAALGLPVLAGIGWAAGLSLGGWLWLLAATLLLLAVPPLATALLLLVAARTLGMRRVRAAVTVVSIGLGLAITCLAVVGASRAAQGGGLDLAHLQRALRGGNSAREMENTALTPQPPLRPSGPFPRYGGPATRGASAGEGGAQRRVRASFPARKGAGASSLLPSAWAAAMLADTAGGRALGAGGWAGFGALLAAAGVLTVLCLPLGARVLTSDAFLEPTDTGHVAARVGRARGQWAQAVPLPVWGLLAKDARYLTRDLILLGQIGTAGLLFLVPLLLRATQGGGAAGDADLYGALALGMLGLIAYMVTSIVSLTSVGLEGRGAWLVLAAPVSRGQFVRAKWLGAWCVSAGITAALTLIAWPLFGLGAAQAGWALLGVGPACFALSGLGVGLAGLFPRFVYENPAHRASVWALLLGFVLATAYASLCGLIGLGAYLLTAQGIESVRAAAGAGIGLFLLLSGVTGVVPIALAVRRLRGYEWE